MQTVAQFIEELQKLDQDKPIVFEWEGQYHDAGEIKLKNGAYLVDVEGCGKQSHYIDDNDAWVWL